jgi:protein-S-isoprenylcysteine O-methyltransferase Ste14
MQSFITILIAVLVYGLIHSVLAAVKVKAAVRRWLGDIADQGYRLAYNMFAILGLMPIIALMALLPDHHLYNIPFPWMLINLSIQGLAGLALLVGLIQTGLWSFLGFQQLIEPRRKVKSKKLTGGLYRWVRHPLYTAGLVFIWFVPAMTSNLLAVNIGLTIYIIVGAIVEERKLLDEFGGAYQDYCSRVPMLLPRPPREPEY